MTQELHERIASIEDDLRGTRKDGPGVLMRLDRLERLVQLVVYGGGMGLAWKVVDTLGQFITNGALAPHR